ncbi:YbaK/EbsC family protein [Halocatena marina]|uniref:YbaK/EbsC family protein n=1 Tax=Halocatena marina TaxID=2934937 RepID=UPI00200E6E6B|nr:YbaK/EbsC family protein [Halocatena marina]
MHHRTKTFVEQAEKRYDFVPEPTEFPDGTKTAADAANAIGCNTSQIASSIVVTADSDPVVVITSGANRVDTDTVAEIVGGTRVVMADADTVKKATGWSIGGVPPICHKKSLTVLLDETLLEHDTVWAAAGTPSAVFPVSPERLRELAAAAVADIAE